LFIFVSYLFEKVIITVVKKLCTTMSLFKGEEMKARKGQTEF